MTCARRFLGVIGENTRRMGKLIDDLLAFAKLGRQSMTHTEVDMTALAREAFADLTELADQNFPELKVEALPAAHGDRQLLRQYGLICYPTQSNIAAIRPFPGSKSLRAAIAWNTSSA
jgi:light-regulated signal transduction histidine kinase (bacteriophytochrome)